MSADVHAVKYVYWLLSEVNRNGEGREEVTSVKWQGRVKECPGQNLQIK